jgi:hypothetical protein
LFGGHLAMPLLPNRGPEGQTWHCLISLSPKKTLTTYIRPHTQSINANLHHAVAQHKGTVFASNSAVFYFQIY